MLAASGAEGEKNRGEEGKVSEREPGNGTKEGIMWEGKGSAVRTGTAEAAGKQEKRENFQNTQVPVSPRLSGAR